GSTDYYPDQLLNSISMLFKFRAISIAALAILTMAAGQLNAQSSYSLSSSELKVSGTSTLHDWEMTSTQAAGRASMVVEGTTNTGHNSMLINMSVTSLKSGKRRMDKIAYETLESDDHPTIRFELKEVLSINGSVARVKGNLTIAGQTRSITTTMN